jgi:hypothetical protein
MGFHRLDCLGIWSATTGKGTTSVKIIHLTKAELGVKVDPEAASKTSEAAKAGATHDFDCRL